MKGPWVHTWRCMTRGLPACLLLLAACVDTRKVIVEAGAFEDPPAAASGFVGYGTQANNRPVCGNCHIGKYTAWKETQHASAWQDLESSGARAAACEGCHTVNALGNAHEGSAGYAATKDRRYWDVQCESCHGPGLAHITDPDGSQPLASIEVGTATTNGCGGCHQGAHTPYVEEWAASRHGNRGTHQQEEAACVQCHEARGVFGAWGVKAEYVEREEHEAPVPIVCAVCHDPHDAANPHQLRYRIDVADVEQNLCMKCHHKRAMPDVSNARGAHSPQGPLLLGENVGWVPPNMTYDNRSIVATHGTERNPRLCAGCHVVEREIKDAAGRTTAHSTGHLFQAIPCLDAQGAPVKTTCTLEQRSFKACTASGCHGTETAARSALSVARTRLATLSAALSALVAKVPATEFNTADGKVSTAEGAKFNAELALQGGSAIHNPFLVEALLTATIKQMQTQYGLVSSPLLPLDNQLGR